MWSSRLLVVLGIAAASAARTARPRQQGRRARDSRSAAFVVHPLTFDEYESPTGVRDYLIQFRGDGDDYCKFMEPLKERLWQEEGIRMRVYEVWRDDKAAKLFRLWDGGNCGGVPYFYNKKTKQWICGATTYPNLRDWAVGAHCENFLPPQQLLEKGDNQVTEQGKMFLSQIKQKAVEKMEAAKGAKGDGATTGGAKRGGARKGGRAPEPKREPKPPPEEAPGLPGLLAQLRNRK